MGAARLAALIHVNETTALAGNKRSNFGESRTGKAIGPPD
jgi:hypothetical protein